MKQTLLLLAIITPLLIQSCKKDEVVKKNEFSIGESSYTIESIDVVYLNGGLAEMYLFSSKNNFNAPLMNILVNMASRSQLAEGLYGTSSNQALQGIVLSESDYYEFTGGTMEITQSGDKYIFEFSLEANSKQITGYYKDVVDIRINSFTFQSQESIINYAQGYYTGKDSVLFFFDSALSDADSSAPYMLIAMNSFIPTLYSFTSGTYNHDGSPLGFVGVFVDNLNPYDFNGGSLQYSENLDYSTLNFNISTLDGNITGGYTGPLYISDASTGTKSQSTKKGLSKADIIKMHKTQKSINKVEPSIKRYLNSLNK